MCKRIESNIINTGALALNIRLPHLPFVLPPVQELSAVEGLKCSGPLEAEPKLLPAEMLQECCHALACMSQIRASSSSVEGARLSAMHPEAVDACKFQVPMV